MVKRVVGAKIACLDFSLQKTKMKMGVHVVISDPEKLDLIRQRSVVECFPSHIWKSPPIYICCDAKPVVHTVIRVGENMSSPDVNAAASLWTAGPLLWAGQL